MLKLCNLIIGGAEQDVFFNDVPDCTHFKLSEHRSLLAPLRRNGFQALVNSPSEFGKLEAFERDCLMLSEILYDAIPADHVFRKEDVP